MTAGNTAFAEEYLALRILCEQGGIVLMPWMRANLNLKRLRLNRIFFGFRGGEELETGCFGAEKSHYVIQALLMTYQTENLYNQAFLPLRERLRDFLILRFGLKPNGKSQLLKKEIQVFLPSVLSYDMQNGENCCKRADIPVPEGYQAVEDDVLRLWSGRILENWNLYKKRWAAANRFRRMRPRLLHSAELPKGNWKDSFMNWQSFTKIRPAGGSHVRFGRCPISSKK